MKYIFAALLYCFSINAFAMFCPTNFSQIEVGDSIDHVIQLCGNPDSMRNMKQTTNLSEEWVYYVKTQLNSKTTAKMSVVIANNKVINISLDSSNPIISDTLRSGTQPVLNISFNNQGPVNVGSSDACGSTISIGDTLQQVENSCGKPALIKQNQAPDAQAKASDMTLLVYGGPNAATLVFARGLLKERIL